MKQRKTRNVFVLHETTFVLQKKIDPRQKLLAAISTGKELERHHVALPDMFTPRVACLLHLNLTKIETDSWLENTGNGLMGSQIVKNGQTKFLFILPVIRFSMIGKFAKSGTKPWTMQPLLVVSIWVHFRDGNKHESGASI
ncbi:hypothetical protein CRYUN_Cryun02cG0130200 [Craigia yunnanensis]